MDASVVVGIIAVSVSGLSLVGSLVALRYAHRADERADAQERRAEEQERRSQEQERREEQRFKKEREADLSAEYIDGPFETANGYVFASW